MVGEHIAGEIAAYTEQYEEYEKCEESAMESYDYVRKYWIEKEAFAHWMVEVNKNMLNPVTLFEARLHFECNHLNYFEDFDVFLKDRKKKMSPLDRRAEGF